MKPILPTLKEKKRYIAFEIITDSELDNRVAKREITEKCLSFLGYLDAASAGIIMVDFNKVRGILKVNNKYVEKVKMAFSLIKEINGHKVIINCIKVSGILNKAKVLENKNG